ncbi:MAG: hypothetical protein A3G75_07080 [Verrucomicrobia bacterium RIFCSPLOWO2_12_FULL_64_8]|nr:MAG: hypothetical protein A3G75_07080 [Verrucomicrobia bacterium RIFCSPLOWO2_12_FULL_64_8]
MKHSRILNALAGIAILAAGASMVRAADEAKTLSGEAKCAKCALKEQATCQTVIQVKEGNQTVNYYVADNDVSKAFHKTICQGTAQVNATGTVKTVNSRLELTASKIEVAK